MKTFTLGDKTYNLVTDDELRELIERNLPALLKVKTGSELPGAGCFSQQMFSDTPNYRFNYVPVEIHIPLPITTCCNWEYDCNISRNVGIIYKGIPITLGELRRIRDMLQSDIPEGNNMLQVSLGFDGIQVTSHMIAEINFIEDAIEKRKIGYRDREKKVILR